MRLAVQVAAIVGMLGCGSAELSSREQRSGLSLSAELDVSTATLGPAPGNQFVGAVEAITGGYLVAWGDTREPPSGTPEPSRVFYTRVSADGTVLDPAGGLLAAPSSEAFGRQYWHAACDGGDHCLFVGSGEPAAGTPLVAVRLHEGQILDATPRDLGNQGRVEAMDWDGSGYRLILSGGRTARVGLDGEMTAPVALPIGDAFWYSLVCGGPDCLVVYGTFGPSRFTLIAFGRIIDASDNVGPEIDLYTDDTGSNQWLPPVWGGDHYWLAVNRSPRSGAPSTPENLLVQIAADGTVEGAPISMGTGLGYFLNAVVHDGQHLIVWWSRLTSDLSTHEQRISRVDDSGTVLDPDGLAWPTPPGFAACRDDGCLLARSEGSRDAQLRGTLFSGTTPADPVSFDIVIAPPSTNVPGAVYAHGKYAVVWQDSRASSTPSRFAIPTPIRGTFLSPDLTPNGEFEVGLSGQIGGPCRQQLQPAIAASSSAYMVVWHEACGDFEDNMYGQAFDLTGQRISPVAVLENNRNRFVFAPSIASDGTGFFAVWDSTYPPISVEGRLIGPTGATIGLPFVVAVAGLVPKVAFDGTNYLVVWQRNERLVAVRVSPTGQIIGPEVRLTNLPDPETGQSIACHAGTCMVSWRSAQVRVARIRDGVVLDPNGIVLATRQPPVRVSDFRTSLAWDGTAYVVMWLAGAELRSARVSETGAILPITNATIAAPPTPPANPIIVSDGAGHLMALYDRFDPAPPFHTRRVRAISIIDNDPPPP